MENILFLIFIKLVFNLYFIKTDITINITRTDKYKWRKEVMYVSSYMQEYSISMSASTKGVYLQTGLHENILNTNWKKGFNVQSQSIAKAFSNP